VIPVVHSVPSGDGLAALVRSDYALGEPAECRYLSRGLNDTYLLRTTCGGRYIVRVYRAGWRTPAAIRFEFDFLEHLAGKGVRVSTPAARRDGELFRAVRAPEGIRYIALFTYADGRPPTWSGEQCAAYGRAAAALHNASDDFVSRHERFRVDLDYLVDRPLRTLRPLMAERAQEYASLQQMAERLHARIDGLAPALSWGIGHADLQVKNVHLADGVDGAAPSRALEDALTFFDFDCCGPTWRAFDLAWCRMEAAQAREQGAWSAFLRGYRERRPLGRVDVGAIPWFVLAIRIWWMGLIAELGPEWGAGWLDEYLTQNITFLRRWERAHLPPALSMA
jgi:Ser/Thr protein kinase RdoA (MazF antagonist)